MAGILRAAEAKVRRIEVRDAYARKPNPCLHPNAAHLGDFISPKLRRSNRLPFVLIVCQALEFDGPQEQEKEKSQNPEGSRVEQTKSPPGKRESPPCSLEKGDEIADMKEANMDGNQTPIISAPERIELVAELDGTFTPEGGMEVDPNIAYDTLPGRLVFPSGVPVLPNAIHQSWLNGQTTLQQAGQCIGAELEVAMLCMQKRLGKVNAHQSYGGAHIG